MITRNYLSQSDAHLQHCVARNKKNAALVLVVSEVMLVVTWGLLNTTLPTVKASLLDHLGTICVVGVMTYFLVSISCRYERIWFALAITAGIVALAKGLFPGIAAPVVTLIQGVSLLLWFLATLVSLGFVWSAFRGTPRNENPQSPQSHGAG